MLKPEDEGTVLIGTEDRKFEVYDLVLGTPGGGTRYEEGRTDSEELGTELGRGVSDLELSEEAGG